MGGNANCPAASAGVLPALGNHKTSFLGCEKSVRISQKEEGELGGSRCGSELKFLELSSFILGAFLAPRPSLEKETVCVSWGRGSSLRRELTPSGHRVQLAGDMELIQIPGGRCHYFAMKPGAKRGACAGAPMGQRCGL